MENPEIKALLKSAKDAIKAKEFGEALKICKVSFLICKIRILKENIMIPNRIDNYDMELINANDTKQVEQS